MDDAELAFVVLFFVAFFGLAWWGFWYAPRRQREREAEALRTNDHAYVFERLWASRHSTLAGLAGVLCCYPFRTAEYLRGLDEARARTARGEPIPLQLAAEAFAPPSRRGVGVGARRPGGILIL